MPQKGLHVTPNGGKWAVREAGKERATRVVDTQREAIDIAREKAKRHGAELYVHGRDGRIRERNSYGNDPNPPKG
jgi:hypothetical protein